MGMKRRFLHVPFNYDIDKDKSNTKSVYFLDNLYAEIPGIYKKCLYAFKNTIKRQGFKKTEIMRQGVQDIVVASNPFEYWFAEHVVILDKPIPIAVATLYGDFVQQFEGEKFKMPTRHAFTRWLKPKLDEIGKGHNKVGRENTLTAYGIGLKVIEDQKKPIAGIENT